MAGALLAAMPTLLVYILLGPLLYAGVAGGRSEGVTRHTGLSLPWLLLGLFLAIIAAVLLAFWLDRRPRWKPSPTPAPHRPGACSLRLDGPGGRRAHVLPHRPVGNRLLPQLRDRGGPPPCASWPSAPAGDPPEWASTHRLLLPKNVVKYKHSTRSHPGWMSGKRRR